MRTKLYLVLGIFIILFIVGAVFIYINDRSEIKQLEKEAVKADKLREQWQANKIPKPLITAETASPQVLAENQNTTAEKTITDELVQTSSNPMFADGVPAHLQCPEQWIGKYAREIKLDPYEIAPIMGPRVDEILSKYNPHRPLTEVWPLFIEAEKYHYVNADPDLRDPGQAQGRLDWTYQNMLDFPEVFVLNYTDHREYKDRIELLRDVEHFETMRQVAIGHWDPDLNLHKLQDGRELRTRTGYRYQVIKEKIGVNKQGQFYYGSSTSGFSHSGKDAELIKIYLADTSDEELKRLGGWNYNIDPYATGLYTLPKDATARVLEKNRQTYGGEKK